MRLPQVLQVLGFRVLGVQHLLKRDQISASKDTFWTPHLGFTVYFGVGCAERVRIQPAKFASLSWVTRIIFTCEIFDIEAPAEVEFCASAGLLLSSIQISVCSCERCNRSTWFQNVVECVVHCFRMLWDNAALLQIYNPKEKRDGFFFRVSGAQWVKEGYTRALLISGRGISSQ